jgi:uncharacterized protein YwgA
MDLTKEELILVFLRLDEYDPIRSNSKFQLLVLLVQEGGFQEDSINSIPMLFNYSSGKKPYSEDLTRKLNKLVEEGYISQNDDNEYRITAIGESRLNNPTTVDTDVVQNIKLTKSLYNETPVEELIDRFGPYKHD